MFKIKILYQMLVMLCLIFTLLLPIFIKLKLFKKTEFSIILLPLE
jgi:hypothetical protein